MKTVQLFAALCLSLVLTSCNLVSDAFDDLKNDKSLTEAEARAQALQPTTEQLNFTWEVYKFIDDGKDKTYEMEGMRFRLMPGGRMVVRHEGQMFEGYWRFSTSSKQLILRTKSHNNRFLPEGVEELDDEWYVMVLSSTEMHLLDPDDDHPSKNEWIYTRRVATPLAY